jgi:hypothetical protein
VPTSPYPSLALAGGAAIVTYLELTTFLLEALKVCAIIVVVVVVAKPAVIAFTSTSFLLLLQIEHCQMTLSI